MVRKNMNKLIMLVSIILATLLITTPIGVAVEADLVEEQVKSREEPSVESISELVSDESGMIALDSHAEPVEELSGEPLLPVFEDPAMGTTGVGDGGGDTNGEGTEPQDPPESDDPPSDKLIWLDVNGDDLGDDIENEDSDEETTLSGSSTSQIEVDKVFISSDSHVIEREAFVNTTLPLNVVGFVKVDVISGSENLNIAPYFERIDAADEILIGIIASIVYATAGITSIVYEFTSNLNLASIAAIVISSVMLTAVASLLAGGGAAITLLMVIDALSPLGIGSALAEIIYERVVARASKLIDSLVVTLAFLIVEMDAAIGLVQGFGAALQQCVEVLKEGVLVAHAIIMALKGVDHSVIKDYLIDECGISETRANIIISVIGGVQSTLNALRANTFGKFALFASFGGNISLRNLHVEINDCCQPSANEYAAILEVKAFSAGNEFDSLTIGIIYNGDGPGSSLTQRSMPTSTTSNPTTSGTTIMGSTVSGTTGTTGLQ